MHIALRKSYHIASNVMDCACFPQCFDIYNKICLFVCPLSLFSADFDVFCHVITVEEPRPYVSVKH